MSLHQSFPFTIITHILSKYKPFRTRVSFLNKWVTYIGQIWLKTPPHLVGTFESTGKRQELPQDILHFLGDFPEAVEGVELLGALDADDVRQVIIVPDL